MSVVDSTISGSSPPPSPAEIIKKAWKSAWRETEGMMQRKKAINRETERNEVGEKCCWREFRSHSTMSKMTRKGEWSNLSHDLLSQIANSLGLIDFLSFRLVCKDWSDATSIVLRKDKFSRCDPCFLLYGGEGSQCSLLRNDDKVYAIDIPELDGAICLASYEGWLLVFRDGSMFFFCPFSRAKIELPNCPFTELIDHTAAFSSAPTSHDCIVVVICHSKYNELELHMLCRGDNIWSKHNVSCEKLWFFPTTRAALFFEGKFIFWDKDQFVIFDTANPKYLNKYRCRPSFSKKMHRAFLKGMYRVLKDVFRSKEVKRKMGLSANVSVSTCGTAYPHATDKFHIVIQSEFFQGAVRGRPCLAGAWLLPRYHIPPNQSWLSFTRR